MGQHLAKRWVWSNQKDRVSIHIMMMNCWLPTTSSDVIHTQVACQQNEDFSSIWRLSLHKPLMSKEFLRSSSKVGCLSGLLLFDFEPGNHGPLGRLFGPGSANIGTSLRLHLVKHRPHGSQRIRMHGPHLTLFKMQGFNYFVSMSISPATYQRQICWRYPHLFVNAGHIISCEGYKWFYSHHDPAFVWPYPHDCPMLVWRSPAIDAENPLYCQLSWKTLKSCWIAYFVCFFNHLTSVVGFLDISCLLLDPLAGEISLQVKALSFSQLPTLRHVPRTTWAPSWSTGDAVLRPPRMIRSGRSTKRTMIIQKVYPLVNIEKVVIENDP